MRARSLCTGFDSLQATATAFQLETAGWRLLGAVKNDIPRDSLVVVSAYNTQRTLHSRP